MAYQDELKQELSQAKYSPLTGQTDSALRNAQLAALMNAPTLTETANPERQPTITVVPESVAQILAAMADEEAARVIADPFSTMIAAAFTAGAREDAQVVLDYMAAHAIEMDGAIGTVANRIIGYEDAATVVSLLAVMIATRTISAETGMALGGMMQVPDPTWSDTIYEVSDSIAQQRGWPVVQAADVQIAVLQ